MRGRVIWLLFRVPCLLSRPISIYPKRQRPQTSTMATKKSIPTIALAATLAACGGSSSSDDDASNGGPTNPSYADCSAGTQDLDGITYTFPSTSHGDTSQATATNQIEGGEQKWVANAYCNNGVVELSDPKVESTICFGGYQNVGDICEAIIYESCPAQTRIEGDFGTQFSFPEQPHAASETISNLFIATNEEFPEKVDFGSDEIFESLTSDCNDGERIQRDYSVLQTSLNCPAGEQEIGEVNYSFPLTAHNSTINLSGTKTIDGGSQNTSIEGYCANTDMTFSEPVVESVSCDNGYEQSGNSCIRVYNSCPAQTITQGDFGTQFSFPQQEHLASQTASSSFEATNEEFPNLIDFGTYDVDEELTSDCNDGERIQRDYSVLQTSLNCPAGEQEIGEVNYSFPLTAHNSTINLSGTKTIDGGSQNTSIEGYCANTDMTFSEPVVESVSCDNGYEQSGNSCIRVYNSCPAQTITQGDFGTQFSFPQQEHLASQTASSSFEATNQEFPNLIDFGTHNVDEELTSDCNDGERIQRDYSILQTDMNCDAGSTTFEDTTFNFDRQAHNTTFTLNAQESDDYNTTTSSADFSCENTVVSYENNFNQTTEYKELDQSTIIQALQDFYAMTQSSQENNVTFYGTLTDDNNNTYNVNYTNLKGENDLEGILMGHIPDQPDQNVYVIGKDPTGLAYLDFQTEKQGLQDINITADDLVNNDSNIAGTLQEGITLPELQEQMTSLEEGNFVYTNQGLLVYVFGNGNDNSYYLRNQNTIYRDDHGEPKNNTNIFSGIGPNYSFGTPFLKDNSGNTIEVQTNTGNLIGSYEDGVFSLNGNLIDPLETIQKLDKSQIPNASYSLMIPVSNTGNGDTINFPLGPIHKGLMGIPTMTRNENNRINLGTFLYCPGNGTYDNEFDTCR